MRKKSKKPKRLTKKDLQTLARLEELYSGVRGAISKHEVMWATNSSGVMVVERLIVLYCIKLIDREKEKWLIV